MQVPDIHVAAVPGHHAVNSIADLLEDALELPAIAADVILAENVDDVFSGLPLGALADHVLHDVVVGDVVARGLADALVSFTAEGQHLDPVTLRCRLCHGVDVVPYEADGAGGAYGDRPGMKHFDHFIDHFGQLFLAAEHDVLLLHVGHETKLGIDVLLWGGIVRSCLIAAGPPGVVGAAYRAVDDVYHVLDRPDHYAFTAGETASALGDDPRDRPRVRLYRLAGFRRFFQYKVLFPVLQDQVRIG